MPGLLPWPLTLDLSESIAALKQSLAGQLRPAALHPTFVAPLPGSAPAPRRRRRTPQSGGTHFQSRNAAVVCPQTIAPLSLTGHSGRAFWLRGVTPVRVLDQPDANRCLVLRRPVRMELPWVARECLMLLDLACEWRSLLSARSYSLGMISVIALAVAINRLADNRPCCDRFAASAVGSVLRRSRGVASACNLSRDQFIRPYGFDALRNGSYITAHMDSANPYSDVVSFLVHFVNDMLLRSPHGC